MDTHLMESLRWWRPLCLQSSIELNLNFWRGKRSKSKPSMELSIGIFWNNTVILIIYYCMTYFEFFWLPLQNCKNALIGAELHIIY